MSTSPTVFLPSVRRWASCLAVLLTLIGLLVSDAAAQSSVGSDDCTLDTMRLNTGWNYASDRLDPIGVRTGLWTLIRDPVPSTVEPRQAYTIETNPGWRASLPGTRWMSGDPTSVNLINGLYIFQACFCLRRLANGEYPTIALALNIRADDRARVYLNGTLLVSTPLDRSFITPTPTHYEGMINSYLSADGRNCITVEVDNTGSVAMGLNLEGYLVVRSGNPGDPNYVGFNHPRCCSLAEITGIKFWDQDCDGVRDADEPLLAGWIITAQGSDGTYRDTTDADGRYSLRVSPGTYTVGETMQPGWMQSVPGLPGTHTVTLESGGFAANVDFGNCHASVITGIKFWDRNCNGVRDAGEPPLPGWTFTAQGSAGVYRATTGLDGAYAIHVPAGTYTIGEMMQPGWEQTTPSTPGTYSRTLGDRDTVTRIDFGNCRVQCLLHVNNEVQCTVDPKSGEVTYELRSAMASPLDCSPGSQSVRVVSATSSAGAISVTPGSFPITTALNTRSFAVTGSGAVGGATVTLIAEVCCYAQPGGSPSECCSDTLHFLLPDCVPGVIGGVKFWDKDCNGVRDSGEPTLAGWAIILENGNGSYRDTTDSDGRYNFYVFPGTYTVREEMKAGWRQTKPGPPGVYTVSVASGESRSAVDFGNCRLQCFRHFDESAGCGVDPETGEVLYTLQSTIASLPNCSPGFQSGRVVSATSTRGAVTVAGGSFPVSPTAAPYTFTVSGPGGVAGATVELVVEVCCRVYPDSPSNDCCTDTIRFLLPDCNLGAIGGVKFWDRDCDGVRDADEPTLAGWIITAQGSNGTYRDTTDANGRYVLPVLSGSYTVGETMQSGWTQSVPGGAGTYAVEVEDGESMMTVDFGNCRAPQECLDHFGDLAQCTFDPTDGRVSYTFGSTMVGMVDCSPGLQSVRVVSATSSAGVISISPDSFAVSSTPTDHSFAITGSGAVAGATVTLILEACCYAQPDGPPSNCCTDTIQFVLPDCTPGAISGVKFWDRNCNGVRDGGEPTLAGWVITVENSGGTYRDTTDADGRYRLYVPPGTYTVSETMQPGWTQSVPGGAGTHTVTVQSGETVSNTDFGNCTSGRISGVKFWDQNCNGVRDGGEPTLAGWIIVAQSGSSIYRDTTDGAGRYTLDVLPGSYTVGETMQSGWEQSVPGGAGTYAVMVVGNDSTTDIDFGNCRAPQGCLSHLNDSIFCTTDLATGATGYLFQSTLAGLANCPAGSQLGTFVLATSSAGPISISPGSFSLGATPIGHSFAITGPGAVPGSAVTLVLEACCDSRPGSCCADTIRLTVPVYRFRTRIPTDFSTTPGEPLLIPLIADDDADTLGVAALRWELRYDTAVMRPGLEPIATALGGLLEGWSIQAQQVRPGVIAVTAQAPPGERLRGKGPMLWLRFGTHLRLSPKPGDTVMLVSDLPYDLSLEGCIEHTGSPGHVNLTICGLAVRLIEVGGAKYVLEGVVPNPSAGNVEIGFTLGLDGPTRLEIRDANAEPVAVLVDGIMEGGHHRLVWNAGVFPSGLYYCTITSGEWKRTVPIILAR